MASIKSTRGGLPQWGKIAADLLRVQHSEDWREAGFSSFSLYLGQEAKKLNRGKSALWRMISAGEFYTKLLKKLDPQGDRLPSLTDPELSASPESLELLEKIGRVAPSEIMEPLEVRTLDGTISRRELRDIWESYRPLLEGRTKRGRGVPVPQINRKSPRINLSLAEAHVLTQLLRLGSIWLSSGSMDLYRAVHIAGNLRLRNWYSKTCDIVILAAKDSDSRLELHGVEVSNILFCHLFLHRFSEHPPLTDYQWLALTKRISPNEISRIPSEIGIIEVASSGVRVVRRAKKLDVHNNQEFLRSLLKEVARTRRTAIEDESEI